MKVKTLVIDDSGVMRKMVMKSLNESKLAEFDFVEAADGQDALEKLRNGDFDICFIDWNMPNMSGVDFVKEARSHEFKNSLDAIPMVMVTSEKTISKVQEALDQAGADAFISKPFTVQELQVKLKKFTDRAQLHRMRKEGGSPAQASSSGGWMNKIFG